ncbi:hypothetical protein BN1708_007203 [Verticillium longisporum]|uniref:Peptidase S8/S53 domain-containing protein n=1 Tax=Verticillium longisporum TaxID=100787 RepID=A0A0G4MRP6_VERLO|nr:hypothetical protein BN1708_007203 [Verticillium longisporum]
MPQAPTLRRYPTAKTDELISSLGAQGGVTSVEERIRFDSTVFKGTSFNLGIVQKEDEEEVFGANVAGGSYDESQPPNPDGDPFEDCNGHATHVAEIIAALYNPLGFKGAAPGVKIGMFRALAALTLRQWTLPWLPLMKMEVTLSLASRTGKWLEPEAICIAGVAYC